MTANHEPGPWVIQRPGPRQRRMFVRPKFGVGVAIAQLCQRTNRDANAALICAAPDLLEALKGVVRVADRATDEFDAARAAIAKAEGRQ